MDENGKGQIRRLKEDRGTRRRQKETRLVRRTWGLTVAANCTVSASAGRRLGPPAPPSGPENRLLLSGVRSAFPTHCSSDGDKEEGVPLKFTQEETPQRHFVKPSATVQQLLGVVL